MVKKSVLQAFCYHVQHILFYNKKLQVSPTSRHNGSQIPYPVRPKSHVQKMWRICQTGYCFLWRNAAGSILGFTGTEVELKLRRIEIANRFVTRPLCLVESHTLDAAARPEHSLFTSHLLKGIKAFC